jgi:NADH-quinone oxidoreductase subunit J
VNWAGVVFGASAAIVLLGALGAVGLKSIFHNILSFALAMLGVAGVFLSLGSDFLAVVFVLVYVGAVAIAMVYAVMLSYPLDQPPRPRSGWKIGGAALFGAVGAWAIWTVLRGASWPRGRGPADVSAAAIGTRLLRDYVLAFELISVLLVVAMMGAVMVARRIRAAGEGR